MWQRVRYQKLHWKRGESKLLSYTSFHFMFFFYVGGENKLICCRSEENSGVNKKTSVHLFHSVSHKEQLLLMFGYTVQQITSSDEVSWVKICNYNVIAEISFAFDTKNMEICVQIVFCSHTWCFWRFIIIINILLIIIIWG